MHINPTWRVLTVGDGDLTFSRALKMKYPELSLVASVYDSEETLRNKYEQHAIDDLYDAQVPVYFEFDVTDTTCWAKLARTFDVVIFQFPLIPSFTSKEAFESTPYSVNTLNRILLRKFIHHSQQCALDPNGPMLSYITSKDVKPYREWNLEGSLVSNLNYHYLGCSPFNIELFPDYKIRNVDRDKHVKDTSGISYVWSTKTELNENHSLQVPEYLGEQYCTMCRVGEFLNEQDKSAHKRSRLHKAMARNETAWEAYLAVENLQD
ncbi:class I SAM-dependent methyltransferase [Pseudoalteromonas xiamenensis]